MCDPRSREVLNSCLLSDNRYVIVGNHRDAWGFGSVDPLSGTAQLTEVIRVIGEKVKNENWRPRRTIVFANWGAEEYGLIGSREFVEEFVTKLSQRAVAYLNNDICTGIYISKMKNFSLDT